MVWDSPLLMNQITRKKVISPANKYSIIRLRIPSNPSIRYLGSQINILFFYPANKYILLSVIRKQINILLESSSFITILLEGRWD
jgi:hypothetical protein